MGVVLADHIAGTVMSWSDIQANLDLARAWVNAIPVADLSADSIRREHLVRPIITGFPQNAMVGPMQSVHRQRLFTNRPDLVRWQGWGATPDRLTVHPPSTNKQTGVWRLPVGATIDVRRTSPNVLATVSFDANIRANTANRIYYPNGSGEGNAGGHFAFHWFEFATGVDHEIPMSARYVSPLDAAPGATLSNYIDDINCFASRQFAPPGTFQLQLCYHPDRNPTVVDQIDLAKIELSIEVY